MKIIKHSIVILIIFILSGLSVYLEPTNPIVIIYLSTGLGILILTFGLKNKLKHKNFFISKYNILATSVKSQKSYDIPKQLMFEKIKEVIGDSRFKIVDVDNRELEILARSGFSFKSWGENLYFNFEENGDETIMQLYSVALFNYYTWGKNEKNVDVLINDIEQSLTI